MKFIWTTLSVKDMEESLKFYQDIVGLNIVDRFPTGPGMELAFLGDGETKVELVYNENESKVEIGGDISLGFEVDSLDEMLEFVKEKGIKIHSGPFHPNPGIGFFFVQDPNGLRIQFVEQK